MSTKLRVQKRNRPASGRASTYILLTGLFELLLFATPSLYSQEKQDQIEGEPSDYYMQIFVAEPDGGKMRLLMQLTDYGFQGSSGWSRDGKWIAFDCWRTKPGEDSLEFAKIAVVDSEGKNLRLLGDGCMPAFSPKGNRIAYSRYTKGVWLLTITDTQLQPVLLDPLGWGTAWSPDGSRVAYVQVTGPNLVVYDVVEGTKKLLFSEKDRPYRQIQWNFAWSPDSKKLAFKALKHDGSPVLAIVDSRGAEFGHTVHYDKDFLPSVAWSPNGKQVLFSTNCPERKNPRQLYSIDIETNDPPKLLSQQPGNRWIQDPSFSPDGTRLTFSAGKSAQP